MIETNSQRGRVSASRTRRRSLTQAYAERRCLEGLAAVRADGLLDSSDAGIVGRAQQTEAATELGEAYRRTRPRDGRGGRGSGAIG